MKKITKEALITCISEPISIPEISIDKPLIFTCGEIHHIYHRYLNGYVLSGLLTQGEVIDAFLNLLENHEQPCNRIEFYRDLERWLGIDLM